MIGILGLLGSIVGIIFGNLSKNTRGEYLGKIGKILGIVGIIGNVLATIVAMVYLIIAFGMSFLPFILALIAENFYI